MKAPSLSPPGMASTYNYGDNQDQEYKALQMLQELQGWRYFHAYNSWMPNEVIPDVGGAFTYDLNSVLEYWIRTLNTTNMTDTPISIIDGTILIKDHNATTRTIDRDTRRRIDPNLRTVLFCLDDIRSYYDAQESNCQMQLDWKPGNHGIKDPVQANKRNSQLTQDQMVRRLIRDWEALESRLPKRMGNYLSTFRQAIRAKASQELLCGTYWEFCEWLGIPLELERGEC